MSICDSEENRKKLAWLVPGYILLAWFFCVLFQPLGIHSPSSRYHPRLTKYGEQVIYLAQDESNPRHCQNNGSIITLEEGQTSAVVLRLGRVHPNRDPFICRLKVRKGQSLDGISAYVEELDLPEYHDDKRQPGGHWGSFVCHDFIKMWTGDTWNNAAFEKAEKLCGRWSAYDHEGHGTGALETVPFKAMVESCDPELGCYNDINVHIELDLTLAGRGAPYGLSLGRHKDFVIVVTGYKNVRPVLDVVSNFTDPETEAEEDKNERMTKDNLSFTCDKNEHQCSTSPYDDRTLSTSLPKTSPRCIWSKLRCDYHQNCGLGHESDESGCGYFRRIGGGYQERLSSWSVSTMSLLIIVYLAIVLILVLVTMLLLRWHKVLRTPLEVLSESRVHQSPPIAVMDDSGESSTSSSNGGNNTNNGSNSTHPATVSIMVMYRPHKPRNLTQPASVELPPSYESLFMSESPPSYTIAASEATTDEAALASTNQEAPPSNDPATSVISNTQPPNAVLEDNNEHCQCDCDHSKCQNAS